MPRTFEVPQRDWAHIVIEITEQAESGDVIVVGTAAQELHVRNWLTRRNKEDVTVQRKKFVRVDGDITRNEAGEIDAKATARAIMRKLTEIRARHRNE